MPTGKVKWYDAEKGFGFLSREDGEDVYVRSSSLPAGVTTLKAGTRVEFGVLSGRKGDQAHQVQRARRARRRSPRTPRRRAKPEDMVTIVEDLIGLLEGVGRATATAATPTPDRQADGQAAAGARGRARALARRSRPATTAGRDAGRLCSTKAVQATISPASTRGPRGVERHRDADEAADHPRELKQGLGPGEDPGAGRSGTSR